MKQLKQSRKCIPTTLSVACLVKARLNNRFKLESCHKHQGDMLNCVSWLVWSIWRFSNGLCYRVMYSFYWLVEMCKSKPPNNIALFQCRCWMRTLLSPNNRSHVESIWKENLVQKPHVRTTIDQRIFFKCFLDINLYMLSDI